MKPILPVLLFAALCTPALAEDVFGGPDQSTLNSDGGLYLGVMGGVAIGNSLWWHDDIDPLPRMKALNEGYVVGGTVGVVSPDKALSWEADVIYSSSEYTIYPGSRLNSLSVMANVVYTFAIDDTLGIYGGVGVGAIGLQYQDAVPANDAEGVNPGYQAFAGVEVGVSDKLSVTAEVRHQAAFNRYQMEFEADHFGQMEFSRTSVLAGLLVGL